VGRSKCKIRKYEGFKYEIIFGRDGIDGIDVIYSNIQMFVTQVALL